MENIITMCAAGHPASGATNVPAVVPAAIAVPQMQTAAYKRGRFGATNVAVPQTADLPSDVSAMTSERRT